MQAAALEELAPEVGTMGWGGAGVSTQHHVRERGLAMETNMQSTNDANESGCNRERKEASESICQGLVL